MEEKSRMSRSQLVSGCFAVQPGFILERLVYICVSSWTLLVLIA